MKCQRECLGKGRQIRRTVRRNGGGVQLQAHSTVALLVSFKHTQLDGVFLSLFAQRNYSEKLTIERGLRLPEQTQYTTTAITKTPSTPPAMARYVT